jgi:hypothetical protein
MPNSSSDGLIITPPHKLAQAKNTCGKEKRKERRDKNQIEKNETNGINSPPKNRPKHFRF